MDKKKPAAHIIKPGGKSTNDWRSILCRAITGTQIRACVQGAIEDERKAKKVRA